MLDQTQFPYLLKEGYSEKSPKAKRYNCIAWAAGDNKRFWWPLPANAAYWPPGQQRGLGVDVFVEAFEALGFALAADNADLEPGFEKVALYAKLGLVKHAARQLSSGMWTSKIGSNVDIEHSTLHALEGPYYGEVIRILKRRI